MAGRTLSNKYEGYPQLMATEKKAAAKDARGTKRTCQNGDCGSRFYDLNRDDIVCPICDTAYVIAVAPAPVAEEKPKPAPEKKTADVDPEAVDEDGADLADIETADDGDDTADDTFLETDDDDNANVAAIVAPPADTKEE